MELSRSLLATLLSALDPLARRGKDVQEARKSRRTFCNCVQGVPGTENPEGPPWGGIFGRPDYRRTEYASKKHTKTTKQSIIAEASRPVPPSLEGG